MWPSLAVTTHSNSGQKLLKTLLKKPFLIGHHAWFTEALTSSVFLWYVLQNISLMCVRKLKSRGFKSGDYGGQKLLLASNQSRTVFAL